MLLDGRTALITGGAGRLGSAIAAAVTREGAKVAICDIDAERVAHARAALESGGRARCAVVGDTSVAGDVERIIREAEAAVGAIDVLVTCAAVYPNRPLVEMDVADWDRVFAVNVRGVMLVSQALGRRWIARGTRGSIVNLSSAAARSARRGAAAYCGSKAALDLLTEVLALELGPHGIRVNGVAPGLVMDDVVSSASPNLPEYHTEMLRATPLGRTGSPDEIAAAVTFLASDRSSWTTGAILAVTGGSHCGRAHLSATPP